MRCMLRVMCFGAALQALLLGTAFAQLATTPELGEVNRFAQQRAVKIYGAGGLRQLEAYQSGMLISEDGFIATVASLVLDQDEATVVLHDGRKYTARLVGTDPIAELAVLKIDSEEEEFPFFDLTAGGEVFEGMRVLAFSNLYNVATGDEPVSMLHGSVATVAPLAARRGAFSTRYREEVIILDAPTNNPGAAGGVVVDLQGRPVGMIGKEVRSELTDAWLNFALPLSQVAASVEQIRDGTLSTPQHASDELPEHPMTLEQLGFQLVPDVVPRTPPYIDYVVPDTPAAAAQLRPDDLLVAVGGIATGSRAEVELALKRSPGDQPLLVSILRDDRLVEVELAPPRSEPREESAR